MILKVHGRGTPSYAVGPEIWHQPLADAIREEARQIAEAAMQRRPGWLDRVRQAALYKQLVAEMTAALQQVGDRYGFPGWIEHTTSKNGKSKLA
jgi:hypothetical protein